MHTILIFFEENIRDNTSIITGRIIFRFYHLADSFGSIGTRLITFGRIQRIQISPHEFPLSIVRIFEHSQSPSTGCEVSIE
jgi:hypothetical protein